MILTKNQTIYSAFKTAAQDNLNKTALVYRFRHYTYKQVLDRVNRLAFALTKYGYKKDDVITIMLPNIPFAVYLLYAVNQIGAIANLIHPLMSCEQLREIMKKANSKIIFALDQRIKDLQPLKEDGVQIIAVSPVSDQDIFVKAIYYARYQRHIREQFVHKFLAKEALVDYDRDYQKDAFYLHSGGTTGIPKTIALSSFALNALAISGLKILDIKTVDNHGMLSVLPMFHGFGLCMGIHACLMNGAFNVLMPKFKTKETVKYLNRNLIHTLIGVPILYEALLANKDFAGDTVHNIGNAFVGGDFVSDSLVKRFNRRMKEAGARARLFEGYGLTETVTVCTVNTHPQNRQGSVGRPIPFVEVAAFDNETKLPPDIHGELYVNGETLMNGYRFETSKTDPFFIDKHGVRWLKTGDYGKVDKDGYVYFVQRLKRIIKVNGINIFPAEIENAVSSLPYVHMCYAKAINDEKRGSMINLYVVLDRNAKDANYDDELRAFIKDKFSVYALPKKIIYVDSLPKTLIGKVDEKQLKDE